MVDAVTAAAASGAAAQDSKKLAGDFDDFLTLLTTQLQNQDPLDPMDSGEFTQQLVAFTGVEQQITTNQNLETIANLSRLQNLASSHSYLGNDALMQRDLGDHNGDGITWQYTHPGEVDATLEVQNELGETVYSQPAEPNSLLHTFEWNGLNSEGEMAPVGNYQLKVTGQAADGENVDSVIFVQETITAVDTSGFEPLFTIGPNEVGQTEILQLLQRK